MTTLIPLAWDSTFVEAVGGFLGRRFAKPDPLRRRRRRRIPQLVLANMGASDVQSSGLTAARLREVAAAHEKQQLQIPFDAPTPATTLLDDIGDMESTDGAGLTTNADDSEGARSDQATKDDEGPMGSSRTSSMPPTPRADDYDGVCDEGETLGWMTGDTGPTPHEPEWETDPENETCLHVPPVLPPIDSKDTLDDDDDDDDVPKHVAKGAHRRPMMNDSDGPGSSEDPTDMASSLAEGNSLEDDLGLRPLGSRPLRRRHRQTAPAQNMRQVEEADYLSPTAVEGPAAADREEVAAAAWALTDWVPGPLLSAPEEDPVASVLDDGLGSRFTPDLKPHSLTA